MIPRRPCSPFDLAAAKTAALPPEQQARIKASHEALDRCVETYRQERAARAPRPMSPERAARIAAKQALLDKVEAEMAEWRKQQDLRWCEAHGILDRYDPPKGPS